MTVLSDLQQRFVDEYLVDLNGQQAAIRAGYAVIGAGTQAYRLLKNAQVYEARGERTEIEADRVLKELARIAFSDIKRVAEWTPDGVNYVASEDLDDDTSATISEFTDKTTTSQLGATKREQKIKLHDKMKALDMLGRHLGMFKADEAQDQSQVLAKVLEVLASGGISIDHIVAHLAAKKAG